MTTSPHEVALGIFRPPLATPALAEARHAELSTEAENYLLPLVDYCDRQEQNEELSEWQFKHVHSIREAIAALLRYDQQTLELLDYYRKALAAAQQRLAAQVPSLEQALQPDEPTTDCRLLITKTTALLSTPRLLARAALPLDHRRALAAITSADLAKNERR